jgi:hypothetical protein
MAPEKSQGGASSRRLPCSLTVPPPAEGGDTTGMRWMRRAAMTLPRRGLRREARTSRVTDEGGCGRQPVQASSKKGSEVRIKLADSAQLRSLVLFLTFDQNALVTTVGESEIEVGFIGSMSIWAQQRETELRLRSWMASHPDAIAVISG